MSAEVVLLVDDEASIRALAKSILTRREFRVLEAADAKEALALVQRLDGAIDALVTDIRMPGMDGFQLAEAVRATRPDIPVVYISGYCTNREIETHNHPDEGRAFLAKPFRPETLTDAVKSVIAASRSRSTAEPPA